VNNTSLYVFTFSKLHLTVHIVLAQPKNMTYMHIHSNLCACDRVEFIQM